MMGLTNLTGRTLNFSQEIFHCFSIYKLDLNFTIPYVVNPIPSHVCVVFICLDCVSCLKFVLVKSQYGFS